MSFTYTSRLPGICSTLTDKTISFLDDTGETIANKAERIARQTGIRYTHTVDTKEMAAFIGSSDKAAIDAEYGTGEYARGKGTAPTRPLRKALSQTKDRLGDNLAKELREIS